MKKIVLHACCAPCASYPIIKLQNDGYRPVVFFYNPNIYPFEEYKIRRDELKKYCEKLNIEFFEEKYNEDIFKEAVYGFENEPEKGRRCSVCFLLRLLKTAEFARDNKINYFTTTLSVSPHKVSEEIFKQGQIAASKTGVEFLEYNFKKQNGFKISREIARENNMYAQKYCGCKYSMR
ncbi:MAG: epoxyqueuosine reductase QueH [Candidatus Gastranaerophilales bacterium]|nr:epoxyqueuosine reductase QueH [Candidatus Gastranaerophilales bacterium]